MCPKCHIVLVEANSASMGDLSVAVNEAVALGASVVSNSYGEAESDPGMASYAASFNHPGIPIVAASGNGSGGLNSWQGFSSVQLVPAAYSTVIAVGATWLNPDSGNARGWDEYGYWSSGSGCSTLVPKPSWQHDSVCSMRTVADVSFNGAYGESPSMGFYDAAAGGWVETNGTSAGAAAVSGILGASGTVANDASFLYGSSVRLNDITTGSNGAPGDSDTSVCDTPTAVPTGVNFFSVARHAKGSTVNSLCHATAGYDAVTGSGTPNGPFPAPPTPAPPCSASGSGTPNPHPTQNAQGGTCSS
jgi:hypothetical protein